MVDANRQASEAALTRYWDILIKPAGATTPVPDLDPALAATIDRLTALDAAHGVPKGVMERVWAGVIHDDFPGPVSTPSRPSIAANGHCQTMKPAPSGRYRITTRRWRSLLDLAAVAALIIAIGVGIITTTGHWSDHHDDPPIVAVAGSPEATPSATSEAACTVAPRSRADVERLNAAGTGPAAAIAFDTTPVPFPAGSPVDQATFEAVRRTIRDFDACAATGSDLRLMALVTDRYLTRVIATEGPFSVNLLSDTGTPISGEGDPVTPVRSEDMVLLPDGRVAVRVTMARFNGAEWAPPGIGGFLQVFKRVGSRYLLDDRQIIASTDAAPAAPAADIPAPEECTVAPLAVDDVRALATAGATSQIASAPAQTQTIVAGPPADPATIERITAATREQMACQNAGDSSRWLAFFSDRWLRSLLVGGTLFSTADGQRVDLVTYLADPEPVIPPDRPASMPAIRDTHVLPDGRVAATIAPVGDPTGSASLYVFALYGDRYLIDGVLPAQTDAGSDPSIPTPDECTIDPLSPESVRALATPSTGTPVPLPTGSEWIGGTPANAATVRAIQATLREQTACLNAGDARRTFVFYSDRALRQLALAGATLTAAGGAQVDLVTYLNQPVVPPPADQRLRVPAVSSVLVLADGRFAVTSGGSGAPAMPVRFVRDGGRYLIDDVRAAPGTEPSTPTS